MDMETHMAVDKDVDENENEEDEWRKMNRAEDKNVDEHVN